MLGLPDRIVAHIFEIGAVPIEQVVAFSITCGQAYPAAHAYECDQQSKLVILRESCTERDLRNAKRFWPHWEFRPAESVIEAWITNAFADWELCIQAGPVHSWIITHRYMYKEHHAEALNCLATGALSRRKCSRNLVRVLTDVIALFEQGGHVNGLLRLQATLAEYRGRLRALYSATPAGHEARAYAALGRDRRSPGAWSKGSSRRRGKVKVGRRLQPKSTFDRAKEQRAQQRTEPDDNSSQILLCRTDGHLLRVFNKLAQSWCACVVNSESDVFEELRHVIHNSPHTNALYG